MRNLSLRIAVLALLAGSAMGQSGSNAAGTQTNSNSQMQSSSTKPNTSQTDSNMNMALPGDRTKLGGTEPTARISREVVHELLMNPYYSVFDNLAYRVEGNTVTLFGSVIEQRVKDDAVSSVKKIEGVDKVVDKIDLLPPSPMDDQIRRAEYRALFGGDSLSRYSMGAVPPIHIVVKGGHVQLVGVVDSQADKDQAGIRANGVPNVFSVQNDLQVVGSGSAKK